MRPLRALPVAIVGVCLAAAPGGCTGRGGFDELGRAPVDDGDLVDGGDDVDVPACVPRTSTVCSSGHMVYRDSCGELGERAEDCRARGCTATGCNAAGELDLSGVVLRSGATLMRLAVAQDGAVVLAYVDGDRAVVQLRTQAGWAMIDPDIDTSGVWDWSLSARVAHNIVIAEQREAAAYVARYDGVSWGLLPDPPLLEAVGTSASRRVVAVAIHAAQSANGVVTLTREMSENPTDENPGAGRADTVSLIQFDPVAATWSTNTRSETTLFASGTTRAVVRHDGLALVALSGALAVEARQGSEFARARAGDAYGLLAYAANPAGAVIALAATSDDRLFYGFTTGTDFNVYERTQVFAGVNGQDDDWSPLPRPVTGALAGGIALVSHDDLPVAAYPRESRLMLRKWDGVAWQQYFALPAAGADTINPKLASTSDVLCAAWENGDGTTPGIWCYSF